MTKQNDYRVLQGKNNSKKINSKNIKHPKREKGHVHHHSATKYKSLPKGLQELAKFHGHLGPYAIVGYKMGSIARVIFELEKAEKGLNIKDIVAYSKVGTKPPISCVSDGIQASSGCTLGKGNIKVTEEGLVECLFKIGSKELTISLRPKLKKEIDDTMSKEKEIERSMWIYNMDCSKLFSFDANFSIEDVLSSLALHSWKEFSPSDAFNQGLDECAGKLFVPDNENLENADFKLISASWLAELASYPNYAKFFASMKESILFQEPHVPVSCAFWAIFGHLVKGEKYLKYLGNLAHEIEHSLQAAKLNFDEDTIPNIKKALAYNQCTALLGIIDTLCNDTTNKIENKIDDETKQELLDTRKIVEKYQSKLKFPGIEKGDFEELFPIFEKNPESFGREKIYQSFLKNIYDYPETPEELLKKGEGWLDETIPKLNKVAEELAKIYNLEIKNTDATDGLIEKVEMKLSERTKINSEKLLEFMSKMREVTLPLVKKRIVSIVPEYDVRIVKTPDYLVNIIPSAAVCVLDGMTPKPFAIFFLTCHSSGKEGGLSAIDMLQMLIHEEYGHCVNYLNSAHQYVKKLPIVERLNSGLSLPITEGISFHREQEFLDMFKEIVDGNITGNEEKDFINFISQFGDVRTFYLEMEFYTLKWQLIRYLRIIGDVRLNLNLQNITEFVSWAEKKTGLSKRTIFNQIFVFQENPGYAPSYAITGNSLKELQNKALKRGKDILQFNTFACSIGFPPRTIWEKRLNEF